MSALAPPWPAGLRFLEPPSPASCVCGQAALAGRYACQRCAAEVAAVASDLQRRQAEKEAAIKRRLVERGGRP